MVESPEIEMRLQQAVEVACENVAQGGGPFGAVITRGGEVVAIAANQVTRDCDPTAHAEVLAIRRAATALGRFSLVGCELFSSCEPCPMCLGAILWARLDRVYFAATQHQAAQAGFDDADFYQQFTVTAAERRLPMIHIAHSTAATPFQAWARQLAKVAY